eukprot:1181967-Rhodomonas_salina.2
MLPLLSISGCTIPRPVESEGSRGQWGNDVSGQERRSRGFMKWTRGFTDSKPAVSSQRSFIACNVEDPPGSVID